MISNVPVVPVSRTRLTPAATTFTGTLKVTPFARVLQRLYVTRATGSLLLLWDATKKIIDLVDGGASRIVVDMEKVDFLDSTGLGVLVGGLKRVRMKEGSLSIVTSQDKILKIFDITGDRTRAVNEYRQAVRTRDNTQGALEEAEKYLAAPFERARVAN